MSELRAPGVYLREVEEQPPPGLPPMHITGFVGQAERGPLNYPQPLTNWGQFRDIFGDFAGHSFLAYAVFGFFLNGGRRCYVVRVASEQAFRARLTLNDASNDPVLKLEAINVGAWGNTLQVALDQRSTDDLALTTLLTGGAEGGRDVTLKSIIGLAEGDALRFVHPRDPIQEKVFIEHIERRSSLGAAGGDGSHPAQVRLTDRITTPGGFPSGSTVMARGFKLTIRQVVENKTLRQEVFDNLAMDPAHSRYVETVINGDPEERDYVKRAKSGLSILVAATTSGSQPFRPQTVGPTPLTGGSDGSLHLGIRKDGQIVGGYAYYTGCGDAGQPKPPPPDTSGCDPVADPVALAEDRRGLAAFEAVGEIGLIAIPDLVIPDLFAAVPTSQIPKGGIIFADLPASLPLTNLRRGQEDMLNHCRNMGERFAILDAPPGAAMGRGENPIERWPEFLRDLPAADYGALYYPWLREKGGDFGGRNLLIPPSGHVAGIYAATEVERGAGKAPANELVQGVVGLEFAVGDPEQAVLNERSVNCVRAFTARGIRVWGARTLSTNATWRYVNVRRVSLLILKAILVGLAWTVFEPNGPGLRNSIAGALNLLMRDLFQRGAFVGATAADAYYVRCDETNNPRELAERGEIVAEVGFALARPAEYIVVTVRRTAEAVSISQPV
jgi:uncharacterized protein